MKTLKAEEVNGKAYKPIEEARGNIGIFIDQPRPQFRQVRDKYRKRTQADFLDPTIIPILRQGEG
jgi:hypothetical protein